MLLLNTQASVQGASFLKNVICQGENQALITNKEFPESKDNNETSDIENKNPQSITAAVGIIVTDIYIESSKVGYKFGGELKDKICEN